MTIFEVDPEVTSFECQPHRLDFWMHTEAGWTDKRSAVTDFKLHLRAGVARMVEVKAARFAEGARWRSVEPYLRAAYMEDHGLDFIVLTERQIRAEPRLSNCKLLLSYRSADADSEAKLAATLACAGERAAITINELCRRSSQAGVDRERSFAAVACLVMAGRLRLDLSKPIDLSSKVERL